MSDVDDKLASAWRDASREEPPAALDASLRAAARRAVQAGPGRASQERHMRSWPLATAAVLAVLSFCILQLTPPDEVTPGMVAENNVQTSAARQIESAAPAAEPAGRLDEPRAAPPPAAAPPAPSSTATSGPAAPAPASPFPTSPGSRDSPSYAQPDAMTGAAKGRVAESTSAGAPGVEKKVLRQAAPDADAERDRGSARTQLAQAPASAPAAAAPSVAPTPPAKQELSRDKQNSVDALASLEAREHTELAAARSRFATKDDKALAGANTGGPAAASPPASSTSAPPPAMAAAPRPDPFPAAGSANTNPTEVEARPPGQAGAAAPLAKSAVPADATKDAPIKPPEEWIKLIRKLRSEGRNDDAARELAAFRAAYKERADALLPADLRALPR